MTEPLHVHPDRLRLATLRLSELAERLTRELDRWLGHPAAPPAGSAGAGTAEPAARALVAGVDRMVMRAVRGLADLATALAEAAARYEAADARAGGTRPAGGDGRGTGPATGGGRGTGAVA
jgi:hypothetical protein